MSVRTSSWPPFGLLSLALGAAAHNATNMARSPMSSRRLISLQDHPVRGCGMIVVDSERWLMEAWT
ncbi:MAG: hypothetical protein WCO90_05065 [Planctomycetota bacterium]